LQSIEPNECANHNDAKGIDDQCPIKYDQANDDVVRLYDGAN